MDRRAAIRTLATAAVLPVLAPDEVSALLEARRLVRPGAAGAFVPAALSAREVEIVGLVGDIIIPRTDTPGASDVGVPAFVDLIVSEWMDAEDEEEFREGLTELDAAADARHGSTFAASTAEQRLALVRELDDRLPAPGMTGEPPEGFYPTLKRLVLTGYFTTQVGAAQTGFRLAAGMFDGCVVPGVGR